MDGKIEYCRKDLSSGNIQLDNQYWELIYDSYLTKFGLNKMHAKLIEVIKNKALLECEFVLTQDRFKLTMIEVEEQKLKLMLKNAGTGVDIRECLIYISKWMGQWINPKQITTLDFFNLQKQYERYNGIKKNEKN
ncbi:hypothetical protein [uncultured phage]|nr:hypothetical protein [uncultured phage]CAD8327805.1 hypothetical protein [uncultured phage]